MASSSLNFTKIENLTKPQEFMQWNRRVKEVIFRDDANILSLQPEPEVDADNHDEWITANAKSKSNYHYLSW